MHHYVQFTETCKTTIHYRLLIINRPIVTPEKQTTSPVTYGIYLTIESPIINVCIHMTIAVCMNVRWHSSIYRGLCCLFKYLN